MIEVMGVERGHLQVGRLDVELPHALDDLAVHHRAAAVTGKMHRGLESPPSIAGSALSATSEAKIASAAASAKPLSARPDSKSQSDTRKIGLPRNSRR